ncbi:type II toxin-antitoxin system RelE family toxin [Dyadobacter pollutisoli]|jgi:mRNA interferase RelE/StbE|uniref:Type II toxin-antitoxin system RelE/ParE family toxin n=1 Tax=Dyadobacter pollutisoli TaxID=2910158 RepID=A0A9E8NB84_9BACT|nr:type II toxin-antitoxin system RelE/ParE family toxin [Dyadobacter pollutisoli]WAC11202.1 type II toxin-antitoxin system RelE/ParE family toxin [Dyadobacter pollutisoli]
MNDVYQVVVTTSAQKEIRSLQKSDLKRVITAIGSLAIDPRSSGCKKLVASKNTYRIRIGNYRVLYFIEDSIRIVEISGVKHRREAYE